MQTVGGKCIRQDATKVIYKKFAVCKYPSMSRRFNSRTIALAPRSWLTREHGECAYPVAGHGKAVLSCCNPCGEGGYCEPHAAALRGSPDPWTETLEAEIIQWLERPR
jgi:hypothetical protein